MESTERKWVESRHIGRRQADFYVRNKNSLYKKLFLIGQIITSETAIDKLFDTIMYQINDIMMSERSTVFVYDDSKNELWSLVATGIEKSEIRISSNSGIAGWVFHSKTPIIIDNAYEDDRFNPKVDIATGYHTKQIISVPLLNREKQCIGTLEALNKTDGNFNEDDMDILISASYYVTIALENATLIHEMINKENALRESQEKYRNIVQSIVDGYFEVDLAGNLTFFNDSMCQILGYSKKEMLGLNNRNYMTSKTSKLVYETFNRVYETGRPTKAFGWELVRKDGKIRYVETSISLIKDSSTPIGFRGIARDITELRAFEKAKERVINHLSHELGTPVSIINGSISKMIESLDNRNLNKQYSIAKRIKRNVMRLRELQDIIDDIISDRSINYKTSIVNLIEYTLSFIELAKEDDKINNNILDSITEKLNSFYHIDPIKLQKINVSCLIDELWQNLGNNISRDVAVTLNVHNDFHLNMDRAVLKKLFVGLLRNAIENTPDEGKIEIKSHYRNQNAILEFQDSGVGITAENQEIIFGGFFHTQDTTRYSSKEPYLFNAGGWGSDLLRAKVLSERFGFSIGVSSKRCKYLPSDTDECPGRISDCPYISNREECLNTGGSNFFIKFSSKFY